MIGSFGGKLYLIVKVGGACNCRGSAGISGSRRREVFRKDSGGFAEIHCSTVFFNASA